MVRTDTASITVRPLGEPDAARFQALRLRGLAESPSAFASSHAEECDVPLARVAERLAPTVDRVVLGAFTGSQLGGIVGLVRESRAKLAHKAFLWGIYVDADWRGSGIGRALVTEALRRADGMHGVRQVILGVNAANPPALTLYRAMGFVEFGREPAAMVVDGEPHDEIHMVRVLGAPRANR